MRLLLSYDLPVRFSHRGIFTREPRASRDDTRSPRLRSAGRVVLCRVVHRWCWGHSRVALHKALRSARHQERAISFSGCRWTRASPSSNPQITTSSPRLALKPAARKWRELDDIDRSRRLFRGRGRSLLRSIKLPFSLTNRLFKIVWLAQLPCHVVMHNANCVPIERAIRVWSIDTCTTLLEAQGLWYTSWH